MLLFDVVGQSIKRTDRFNPATDSVEYLRAKFTFNDAAWNDKTKTALFRLGDAVYKAVLNASGICTVPTEVLAGGSSRQEQVYGSTIYVSLLGEYGTIRITTNELPVKINHSGYAEAETPAAPTENEYQQMAAVAADAVAEAEEARAACENARADLVNVKNLFANAVKGYLSGAVVFADDVSPVEHEVKVTVSGADDPSTVTVKRCGKNLLPTHNNTQYGYTVTPNADGSVTVTGASDTDGAVYLNLAPVGTYNVKMAQGVRYSLSWQSENGRIPQLKVLDSNGEAKWITANHFGTLYGTDYMTIVQFYVQIGVDSGDTHSVGDTSLCGTYYFQLEVGEDATDFEPYNGAEYTSDADGTVSGITSLSPNMTILTDTEGVIVECEYNRDTNKVIDKLINAIKALGGTV